MARRGLRKFTKIPILGPFIGVPRAIYRAFSDDKDLVKAYFDLLKNSAVTAFAYAILWVFYSRSNSYTSTILLIVVAFGTATATAALWAQWTHHFGRIFRQRVGAALYPEYSANPILIEKPYGGDKRLNGKKGLRFAHHFCVPRSANAYIERTLMFVFAYGLVAILGLTLFISTKELTAKLLTYLAP